MIPTPRMVSIPDLTLAGMNEITTLSAINPVLLWKKFMPNKHLLSPYTLSSELYAVQVHQHPPGTSGFDPENPMAMWAAVACDFREMQPPEGFGILQVKGGNYAVFLHKGTNAEFRDTMNSIYQNWFPRSDYMPANRAHFQVMGEKYLGPENPLSEEEIWIPVEKKKS